MEATPFLGSHLLCYCASTLIRKLRLIRDGNDLEGDAVVNGEEENGQEGVPCDAVSKRYAMGLDGGMTSIIHILKCHGIHKIFLCETLLKTEASRKFPRSMNFQ